LIYLSDSHCRTSVRGVHFVVHDGRSKGDVGFVEGPRGSEAEFRIFLDLRCFEVYVRWSLVVSGGLE